MTLASSQWTRLRVWHCYRYLKRGMRGNHFNQFFTSDTRFHTKVVKRVQKGTVLFCTLFREKDTKQNRPLLYDAKFPRFSIRNSQDFQLPSHISSFFCFISSSPLRKEPMPIRSDTRPFCKAKITKNVQLGTDPNCTFFSYTNQLG